MNTAFVLMSRKRGFSLVELMIAMVLGLFLIGGVVSVFLSNRQVYRQNENLARMQENARYAFEVVARDVREAAGIACGNNLPTGNVLNSPTASWWSNWGNGIEGYEGTEVLAAKAIGTNAQDRVTGTDAIVIHSSTTNNGVVITDHNDSSAQFKVNTTSHGFADGDIVLVCDYKQAALFQITSASASNVTIVHNTGNSAEPGNCSKGLGYPTVCTTNGTAHIFENGGFLTKLSANSWYIGFNGRGGRSLYRVRIETKNTNNGNCGTSGSKSTACPVTEEIAEGVTNMQAQYLSKDASGNLPDSYVDADSITDWTRVVAVRIIFTLASLETVGTGNAALTRSWNMVVTLRNRQL
ncbi:MAG: pilus assembly protein PilW [Methylomonas sp.]|nr:MAG: pilus assembly protein PilW [Methylomonas sp.]